MQFSSFSDKGHIRFPIASQIKSPTFYNIQNFKNSMVKEIESSRKIKWHIPSRNSTKISMIQVWFSILITIWKFHHCLNFNIFISRWVLSDESREFYTIREWNFLDCGLFGGFLRISTIFRKTTPNLISSSIKEKSAKPNNP